MDSVDREKRFLIVGIAKDIAKTFGTDYKRINSAIGSFGKTEWFIVESDSNDESSSFLENFKSKNDVQLVSAEAQRFLAKVQTGDQTSSEMELQLMVLDDLEKYVLGKIKKPGMAPYSAGMNQVDLNANFKELLTLERELAILAETNGPKSDVVSAAKKEIESTKTLFLETIRNTRNSFGR